MFSFEVSMRFLLVFNKAERKKHVNTFIEREQTRGRIIEPFLMSTWGEYCIHI
jgi:hypothetical protein